MSREPRPPAGLSRRSLLSNAAATAVVGALAGSGSVVAGSGTDADHSAEDVRLESHDGTELAATVFRPEGAGADDPVPMILHSHGWSGSRTRRVEAFERELDRGFGVLSFDQRGHGDSGGKAHVQNPDLEGRDVMVILDYVTDLEWVRRSVGDGGEPIPNDPMTFAIGGSYGGAYQLVGAFTELRERGATRFDALAPQITWYDLSESLAPQGVTRSTWMLVLYLAGFTMQPEYVHRGFLWGLATGQWPQGETPGVPDLDSKFFRNGPSGFVDDGYRLDIPVLFGQGIDDNLFNLNQGWKNLERALTDDARKRSALVGYNGGHALPNVLPPGSSTSGNACSEAGFAERRLRFFEAVRDGGGACDVVDARYQLTTMDGSRCVRREVLDEHETVAVGDAECEVVEVDSLADAGFNAVADLTFEADAEAVVDENGRELEARLESDGLLDGVLDDESLIGDDPPLEAALDELLDDDGTTLTTGVGVPKHLEIAEGPLTVAGIPFVSATVTTATGEQRLFAALSVGESKSDAEVVQNNMMPLREPEPVDGAEREIELPGVAVDVAEDEKLFLTLSAVSDMSIAHGSRVPGIVTLEDIAVDLPVGGEPPEDCDCDCDDGEDDGDSDDGSDDDDGNDDSDGDGSDGGDGDDGSNGDDGDDSDDSGDDSGGSDGSDDDDGSDGDDSGGDDGSDGNDGSDGDDGTDGDDSDDDSGDDSNDDDGTDGGDETDGGDGSDGSDGDESDGDDGSDDDNGSDGDDDSSEKKKKGKNGGDEETGSDDGSTDGTDNGADDGSNDGSTDANESGETSSSESDEGDGSESDDDSSPGVGAIGALGTLGGIGYVLSRRLEAAADATAGGDETGPETES